MQGLQPRKIALSQRKDMFLTFIRLLSQFWSWKCPKENIFNLTSQLHVEVVHNIDVQLSEP